MAKRTVGWSRAHWGRGEGDDALILRNGIITTCMEHEDDHLCKEFLIYFNFLWHLSKVSGVALILQIRKLKALGSKMTCSRSHSMWWNSTIPPQVLNPWRLPSSLNLHAFACAFPFAWNLFFLFAKLTLVNRYCVSLVVTSPGKLFLDYTAPQPWSRLGAHPLCCHGILSYPSLSTFCIWAASWGQGPCKWKSFENFLWFSLKKVFECS